MSSNLISPAKQIDKQWCLLYNYCIRGVRKMVLPDPSKFVSRVRFSHAAPFNNWKIQHGNRECRNVFGMYNFAGLWCHSSNRCHTVGQQPVASLLERSALELAREHATHALSPWTRTQSWPQSRTPFRPEVILLFWRVKFFLHFRSNFFIRV